MTHNLTINSHLYSRHSRLREYDALNQTSVATVYLIQNLIFHL